MRIFRAFELVTTSLPVRNCWEKAGSGIEQRDGVGYLFVHERKIGGSAKFAEVWETDYPEQNLSPRRRQQPWGLLNQCFS
jgi:hypothetical protein